MYYLTEKVESCIFRFIASSSWEPSKEFLCTLYKDFTCPILTYGSPGWFSFSPPPTLPLCKECTDPPVE